MIQTRNFSIIAHIDHGKSTLADRLIQQVGLIDERQFRDQILVSMDLERERGITIKSHTLTLPYVDAAGQEFELNLIDTPGHVDFSYEVSRALASCEGVLLVIDAAQGVEAQTLANLYAALDHNLEIIPVINKIDLPAADPERVKEEIEVELGLDSHGALLCSAKEGTGIESVFEAITARIPPPRGDSGRPLSALIFDAQYDPFRGTVVSCRIFDGSIRAGDIIRFMSNGAAYRVEEVGVFRLKLEPRTELTAGEVGYLIAGIKTVSDTRIGDTVTLDDNPAPAPLPSRRTLCSPPGAHPDHLGVRAGRGASRSEVIWSSCRVPRAVGCGTSSRGAATVRIGTGVASAAGAVCGATSGCGSVEGPRDGLGIRESWCTGE